jgi:hypothetical protein
MDIARQRLVRNFLIEPSFESPAEVVAALGAVQSQDYDGAKWAVAQRTRGATDADVERAFSSGEIVRTHVLRPTWHFVRPRDIRWMLSLTAPRIQQILSSYERKMGLTPAVFRRSNAAIEKALRDGAHLTRAELKTVLARANVGPLGAQRAAHLVSRAELDAIICSGARRGTVQTYALLDLRVPPTAPLDRDEALLELARRYFLPRGPATAHDFSWWSGLTVADARRAIDIAADVLETTVIDGKTYVQPRGTALRRPAPSAHLLPNYDEFFIGYRDRSAIGKRLASIEAVTGGSTLIAHVVVIDGQLVGGWRRTATGITLSLRSRLTAAERRRLRKAIRRFEAFTGRPVMAEGFPRP